MKKNNACGLPQRWTRASLLAMAATGVTASISAASALAQESNNEAPALPAVLVSEQASSELHRPSGAGGRLNLTPLETPASVTVISGDTIRARGYQTLVDAETRAPGITSVPFSGNGNNSLSARGFYGPNSISQLYDGMQLYNAGGVVTFPFDPWNVERVEFLNGPASVLYGTGFIGGAINVVPKKPDDQKQSNSLQLSVGSFGTFRQAFDSTGPINDQLAYRFNISHVGSDGWMERGRNDSLSISAALQWKASRDLTLTLSNDYGDIQPGSYEGTPIFNGQIVPGTRYKNYNSDDAEVRFTENRTYLRARYQIADNLVLNNDVYLIRHERRYKETYTYTFRPATNTVARSNYRDIIGYQTQYGDHGYLTLDNQLWGRKNQLVMGFDLNRSKYDRNDNTLANGNFPGSTVVNANNFNPGPFAQAGNFPIRALYRATVDQAGLFLQDRYQLSEQWAITGGVRGDHYQTQRDDFLAATTATGSVNATSWNGGVVYNPVPDTALYAQYATASDPVTSLASISAAQMQYGVSKGKQVEVGVKQALWGGRAEWTLAAYHIIKSNLLTQNVNTPAISELIGQQSSRGIEGSLALQLNAAWRVEANASILNARFDDFVSNKVQLAGYRPQFVPKRTGNLFVSWHFMPEWEARAGAHYVSDRYSDNGNAIASRLPAYTVADLGLSWQVNPKLKVDFRIDNLTDKLYAASTYAGSTTQWILGQPRSYTATMNLGF